MENLDLLGVWDLIQCFGPVVPKTEYLPQLHKQTSDFLTKQSFFQNFLVSISLKLNSGILVIWGNWGLTTGFMANGEEMVYLAELWNLTSDFHKQALILSERQQGSYLNQIIWKIQVSSGSGTKQNVFAQLDPKQNIFHSSITNHLIFFNQPLILFRTWSSMLRSIYRAFTGIAEHFILIIL